MIRGLAAQLGRGGCGGRPAYGWGGVPAPTPSRHDLLCDVLPALVGVSDSDCFLLSLGGWRLLWCRHYDGWRRTVHSLPSVVGCSVWRGELPRSRPRIEGVGPRWLNGILLRRAHIGSAVAVLWYVVLSSLWRWEGHGSHGHHDWLVWGVHSRGGVL